MTEHKFIGQARKSLWIETGRPRQRPARLSGQARKSLWIETEPGEAVYCESEGSGS